MRALLFRDKLAMGKKKHAETSLGSSVRKPCSDSQEPLASVPSQCLKKHLPDSAQIETCMKLPVRTCATFALITVFPLRRLLQIMRICLDRAEQVWNFMRFLKAFPHSVILSSSKRGYILGKFQKDLGHVVLQLCVPVCD